MQEADEIFLTNSVIGVLPVSQINHQKLNNTIPGPITKKIGMLLLKSFEE